jgi:hypothetical protein
MLAARPGGGPSITRRVVAYRFGRHHTGAGVRIRPARRPGRESTGNPPATASERQERGPRNAGCGNPPTGRNTGCGDPERQEHGLREAMIGEHHLTETKVKPP